ncbi:MAG: GntR family transcriptional regulator [Candidatus Adiutrix sp.]|jgi:GntR family transcriptional regulator|nr:GntR family transcriptional regulator [Candidatus Adiutrix sp.]
MPAKTENKNAAASGRRREASPEGPAYARLAGRIKQMISSGEYQPGAKIPSEAAISKEYGLSPMTVRQAVGQLVDQGLLRRVHGSGTYVCGPDWTRASFSLEGLLELLHDKNGISIKILRAGIVKAKARAAAALEIREGSPIISLMRLVYHEGRPFLLNKASLRFDPRSPIVESELEVSSLSGLFTGKGNSFIKKALLLVEPCLLSPEEAGFLEGDRESAAFKINYTFYGYSDSPVGSGWFLALRKAVTLSTRIGVWDD